MEENKTNPGKAFFKLALYLLLFGLIAGVMSAIIYIVPDFMKEKLGLIKLRPLHVSSVMFWIILGATACVYSGLTILSKIPHNKTLTMVNSFGRYFLFLFFWRFWWERILGV
jgi:hypothetical protein